MPRADTPFARVVSSQAARNHTVKGVRVRWKIVPAVAFVRELHCPHTQLMPSPRGQPRPIAPHR
jgi:hypothetical protein